jgi:hypothetical protein
MDCVALNLKTLYPEASYAAFLDRVYNISCMHDLIFPKRIPEWVSKLLLKVGKHECGRTKSFVMKSSIFL